MVNLSFLGMDTPESYDLIFFDFDGLLVNTERLHYEAYLEMCRARGVDLGWDFAKYRLVAHAAFPGIRDSLYAEFPALQLQEPKWSVLYLEKKQAYEKILSNGSVELMPGVLQMLDFLDEKGIPSCVVTNSFLSQTLAVRKKIPALERIPNWITREDYVGAKPAPDPYLTAKKRYAKPGDRIVGFEDTLKGLEALIGAGIEGVVISDFLTPEFKQTLEEKNTTYFSSFETLLSSYCTLTRNNP